MSESLINELFTALQQDIKIAYRWRREVKQALRESCEMVDEGEIVAMARDPKDNYLLTLALAGRSDYLITGDKDLLELQEYKGISILTPADFLNSFGDSGP